MRVNPVIDVDLTKSAEQWTNVPVANGLWLAKVVNRAGIVYTNPLDAVIAIRFTEDSESDVWGLQDGHRNSHVGAFTRVGITVLTKGAGSRLCLQSGVDVVGGYCNGDGLSPTIGGVSAPSPGAANQAHHTGLSDGGGTYHF